MDVAGKREAGVGPHLNLIDIKKHIIHGIPLIISKLLIALYTNAVTFYVVEKISFTFRIKFLFSIFLATISENFYNFFTITSKRIFKGLNGTNLINTLLLIFLKLFFWEQKIFFDNFFFAITFAITFHIKFAQS